MDKKGQAEKAANQPEEKTTVPVVETPAGSPDQAGNYLAELLSQAENAYTMYRQAQREVAKGYKRQ